MSTINTRIDTSKWGESSWYRYAGAAALLGGGINIGIAFTGTLSNSYEGTTIFWVTMFVQALATGLMLVGLYGLHTQYRGQYGRFGVGLAALFGVGRAWLTVAMVLQGFSEALELGLRTPEESWFAVNLLSMVLASLFGVVLWRNGVLGLGGIVMTATAPIAVVIIVVMATTVGDIGLAFWVPLGVAWIASGVAMLRDRRSTITT